MKNIDGNEVYSSLEQDNYNFADDYICEMIDSLLDGDEEKFDSVVSDFKNLIQDTIKFLKDQDTDEIKGHWPDLRGLKLLLT